MKPRIILHNIVSVDGRMDCFTPNIGLYYELISRWNEDATLVGSNTILSAPEEIPDEEEFVFKSRPVDSDDHRPLLVIPDSKGRVKTWHYWPNTPYWRDAVALCSHSTPKSHLDYLKKRNIRTILTGKNQVDLRSALEELNTHYGIKVVRVDSGGTLNGILLRAGLVDEISLLIDPSLVGGLSPRSIFRAPDLTAPEGLIHLKLFAVEKLKEDIVWLRYEVIQHN